MKYLDCRLEDLLAELGLTRADLRKITGINPDSLRALARGEWQRVEKDTIVRICVALRCTPGDLFVLRDKDLWQSARASREITVHIGSSAFGPPGGSDGDDALRIYRQLCAARDLAAYRLIVDYLHRTGAGLSVQLVDHAMGSDGGADADGWQAVEQMFRFGNHVVIGSMLANPWTELVVCRMFAAAPYTASERAKFPYGFAFESRRSVRSSFAWQALGNDFGIVDLSTGKPVARRTLVPRGGVGEDCALVLVYRIFQPPVRRTDAADDARTIVCLLGHGSLGSEAAAMIVTDAEQAVALCPAQYAKPAAYVVRAEYARPLSANGFDDRLIRSVHLVGA
jgi:DNA-binding Xre family transcriptional regulator